MQNYELFEKIGQGGMGSVYRARHTQLHRDVAIKFMDAAIAHDEVAVERFLREARLLAKIDHPNVVRVYDMGIDEKGQPFIAMELLTGISLNDQLRKGPLSEADAVEVAGQLLLALEESHRHGIVHRDIKASNITLLPNRTVKLLDFGIARDAMLSSVTSTGRIIGTPAYMSPEQAEGIPASPQSDLYSLGIVLYEMLMGVVPFRAETPLSVLRMQADVRPPDLPPNFSPHVRQTVAIALEKKPENRFPNAMSMRDALFARAASTASVPRPATPPSGYPGPTQPMPAQPHGSGGSETVIAFILGAIGIVTAIFCAPIALVTSIIGMVLGIKGKSKRQSGAIGAVALNGLTLAGGAAMAIFLAMSAAPIIGQAMTVEEVRVQSAAYMLVKKGNDTEKEAELNKLGFDDVLLPSNLMSRAQVLEAIQKFDEAHLVEKRIDNREDAQIRQILKETKDDAKDSAEAKAFVAQFEQALGNPDTSGSATGKVRALRDEFYAVVKQYLEYLLKLSGRYQLASTGDNLIFDYAVGTQAVDEFNQIKTKLQTVAQQRIETEASRIEDADEVAGEVNPLD